MADVAMPSATANNVPQQRHDALLDRALEQGVIPVIVRFKTQSEPASGSRISGVREQQARLIARQQRTLGQLGLGDGRDRAGSWVKRFDRVQGLAMQADALDVIDLLDNPDVEDVFEDIAYPPALAQSLPLVGASSGGTFLSYSGQGQVIAILDTGVDKNHPFLAGKVLSEACYSSHYPANGVSSLCPGGVTSSIAVNSGSHCSRNLAGCDHGTHVAGIAAGKGGIAKDAGLISIQVYSKFPSRDCGGSPCVMAYTSDIIRGLERVYALRETYPIAAANLSLGGGAYTAPCDRDPTKSVIDKLKSAGIATVIASGNDGYTNATSAPGCVSSAVTVGSTTKADTVSLFSNSATFLDLLAPGSTIVSSVIGGGFESWSGTSMATPHVAGAWAVLKSLNPAASVEEILAVLQGHGVDVRDPGNQLVKVRIQIDDAIAALANGSIQTAPPTITAPSTPTTNAASNITSGGFSANWNPASRASGYRLDISTSRTFSHFVSGYQDRDLGDLRTLAVTGLNASTTYYYRVRAYNVGGTSAHSTPRMVKTSAVPQRWYDRWYKWGYK